MTLGNQVSRALGAENEDELPVSLLHDDEDENSSETDEQYPTVVADGSGLEAHRAYEMATREDY